MKDWEKSHFSPPSDMQSTSLMRIAWIQQRQKLLYHWLKISREDRRCGTLAVQEEMKKRKIRENEIVAETEVEKHF